MNKDEILKRLGLIDDLSKKLWEKRPVFVIVVGAAILGIGFILGAVIV